MHDDAQKEEFATADEKLLEIFRQLREGQNKYTYFLLAAAGAGVAFALDQTQTASLELSQIPLGVSVLLWGVSFWSGCRNIQFANSTLYDNYVLIKMQNELGPYLVSPPTNAKQRIEKLYTSMEMSSDAAVVNGRRQFRFLVWGAIYYVAWHAWAMFSRGLS